MLDQLPDDFDHPDTRHWAGTAYRVLARGSDTGGGFSVVDSIAPAGFGPPRHVHDAEDETFIIREGRHEFWLEGETFERGPGDVVHVPRGKEHTFRVIGDAPGRHYVILTPGGFEGFFLEMSEGQFAIPDDMPQIEESAGRHNLRFTGPPLGA